MVLLVLQMLRVEVSSENQLMSRANGTLRRTMKCTKTMGIRRRLVVIRNLLATLHPKGLKDLDILPLKEVTITALHTIEANRKSQRQATSFE